MEGKEICGKSDAGYRSPPQIVSNSDRRLLDVSLGGREGGEIGVLWPSGGEEREKLLLLIIEGAEDYSWWAASLA